MPQGFVHPDCRLCAITHRDHDLLRVRHDVSNCPDSVHGGLFGAPINHDMAILQMYLPQVFSQVPNVFHTYRVQKKPFEMR